MHVCFWAASVFNYNRSLFNFHICILICQDLCANDQCRGYLNKLGLAAMFLATRLWKIADNSMNDRRRGGSTGGEVAQ